VITHLLDYSMAPSPESLPSTLGSAPPVHARGHFPSQGCHGALLWARLGRALRLRAPVGLPGLLRVRGLAGHRRTAASLGAILRRHLVERINEVGHALGIAVDDLAGRRKRGKRERSRDDQQECKTPHVLGPCSHGSGIGPEKVTAPASPGMLGG
jgi:hypothetical protein